MDTVGIELKGKSEKQYERRGKILLALDYEMSARTIHSFPVKYAGVMRSKEEVTPSTGGAGYRKITTVS